MVYEVYKVYELDDVFLTPLEARGKPRVEESREEVPGLRGVVAEAEVVEGEEAFTEMLRPGEREFYRAGYIHVVFSERLEGRVGQGQAAIFTFDDPDYRRVAVVHECFIYSSLLLDEEDGGYREVPKREANKRALEWCIRFLRSLGAEEIRISGHEPAVEGWEEILRELGFEPGYETSRGPVYVLRVR